MPVSSMNLAEARTLRAKDARLAQLVEHRSCKAEVSGSIPEAGLD
jgi:hypothetical protein